ncbi:hypothetical protein KPH14_000719 [Odynerus spinipes]|uniref:CCHC-type domain-containing protein n=1 Tax=Odynerus spinipes TaxID=1348599 RepID=A0AAD9RDH6_9HYME|nr:hypothetical protein KPH14_000719 [Odynerus spinipes]
MATSDNNASTNDTQTQMVDMFQNIMKALNALNVPQSRMRHDNPSGLRNGCYVCGGNDHYSRDCTKRQNFPSRRDQNVPPIQFISQAEHEIQEPNLYSEEQTDPR